MSSNFYRDLDSFSDFSEFTDHGHFHPIPSDWFVVVTDVMGSTQAIDSGKYKDVNTLGAASIVVVQNALEDFSFPFIFGGDGASILIPEIHLAKILSELSILKNQATQTFGLELRVGSVSVKEITKGPETIEVAKYELTSGKTVAMIRGGGLSLADRLIKTNPDFQIVPETTDASANLTGLSCRWDEIPNKHGSILALIVAAAPEREHEVYKDLIAQFGTIVKDSTGPANPVHPSLMSYLPLNSCVENEKRFERTGGTKWRLRWLEIVAAVMVFRKKIPPFLFSPKKYKNSMVSHSDYRKFDDALRMIIDCNSDQVTMVENYLREAHQRGDLCYGIHKSETSLMTCFVNSLKDGDHIHFIDAGNGGYAMAAKQLKAQQRANR